ncbi:MAG: DNA recombination protein RmuC [Prevotellaceae bacterium]|jgi:DNA recombination protein RmuC|nr:DNA recombination protein RmuC [Prevotellaceae bacterium]
MNYLLLAILGFILGAITIYFFDKKKIDILHKTLVDLDKDKTVVIATLENDNKNLSEKLLSQKAEIEELQRRLTIEFENIANRILKERANEFSNSNRQHLGEILNPLKEKLSAFERKVEDTYNNETREKASLREQIKQLVELNTKMQTEASNLTKALKGDSKTQGDWGEWQLEMLLETAGLQKEVHFVQQQNFKTEEGLNVRPDYIINLPDNKHYIIDSKVSLTAYERYFNEENEEVKQRLLKEHLNSINTHINDLSAKKYQSLYDINSPDFVFMFIALEPAWIIALQNDPTLYEKAFNKNIMLVSNTTLLATMRMVSFIWKQENQRNNVLEIAKIGGQLYDKFVGFVENMIKVGRNMEDAKKTYTEAMSQLVKHNPSGTYHGGTIVGMTEKLKELGANATKKLPQSVIDRTIENF